MVYTFEEREIHTLTNCLNIAAAEFHKHGEELRATAKLEAVQAGSAWITPLACERLAQQFDRQEMQAYCLANRLQAAHDTSDEDGAAIDAHYSEMIPAGVRVASRFYRRDHCGRASCSRCYRAAAASIPNPDCIPGLESAAAAEPVETCPRCGVTAPLRLPCPTGCGTSAAVTDADVAKWIDSRKEEQ